MSNYYTYAQFISCTNLVDFQKTSSDRYKMNLGFSLPDNSTFKYTKIEIYRYIGPYMDSTEETDISDTSTYTKKIFTAEQNFDSDGEYSGSIQIQYLFPSTLTPVTVSQNLIDVTTYQDDLSVLTATGTELKTAHNLTELGINNSTILNDIGFTRRQLFYIIKTYINGIADSAPYFVTSHYDTYKLLCHSTKTQVKHNYLHFEGDEIWESNLASKIDTTVNPWNKIDTSINYEAGGLSRTSVDTNRLYADPAQATPFGNGGYAWVSDRSSGKVFRHNLRNGSVEQSFNTNTIGRGHGIGVDKNTGDCISAPGATRTYRCRISDGSLLTINTNRTGVWGYGVAAVYGYTDRMFVTDYNDQGSNLGRPRIYNLTTNTYTSGAAPSQSTYAVAPAPNGKAIQSRSNSADSGKILVISPINASSFTKNLSITSLGIGLTSTSSKCAIDSHALYPNTIVSEDLTSVEQRDRFTFFAGHEFQLTVPASATSSSDVSINWAVRYPNIAATAYGYDGENNMWQIYRSTGVTPFKAKYYRTAGDRGDGVNTESLFPYGGNCRYPTTSLTNWPESITNTKEIEWFLTRNSGTRTLNTAGGSMTTLDAATIDNTVSVTWSDPVRGSVTETALAGWNALTDTRMLRVSGSSTYFKVYKDNNSVDSNIKKWGVRMKVSDIYTSTPSLSTEYPGGVDEFYETGSADWLTTVKRRIKAWAEAFADSTTSYLNETNRDTLIAGNQTGRKVFPFYNSATLISTYQSGTWYYINPSLSTDQQNKIRTYAEQIRIYNFGFGITGNVYMYSDFTGNLLAGAVEESAVNIDRIHPDTAAPTIVLLASASQSNPGYQDNPVNCYPWRNTLPVSMSAFYSGITGYDDLGVTYAVSANMGSYLITSVSLSTDDYFPGYLSDVGNTDVFVNTENTSYNSSNAYNNIIRREYTYHSPSVNGLYYLPSGNPNVTQYQSNAFNKSTGQYIPKASISVVDIYDNSTVIQASAQAHVKVLERWPEPRFYLSTTDLPATRLSTFCNNRWGSDRYNKESSVYKESRATDAKRYDIQYGVDPVSAIIQDRSIGRTWGVSSWHITLSTNNQRIDWYPTKSFTLTADSILKIDSDKQNTYQVLSSHMYRYGNYSITMNVQASTTQTSSDRVFTQYINVAEFEPFANFWAISAQTVPSTFTSSNSSITGQLSYIDPVHNGVYTDDANVEYPFISGYAPNLTVWFRDSSEAHTFPICAYHWDFGDTYNEGTDNVFDTDSNYYTVTTAQISSGTFNSPCWITNTQYHTAVHTYIMPGTYDVTLTVKASCTNTSDVCARYIGTGGSKKFYVFVKEIPPACSGGIFGSLSAQNGFINYANGVSGGSPLTAYFSATGIVAGSFPIGRIDWNFGDGTIETVTRIPYTTATSQGLSLVNVSAYSYDVRDPRNMIVPHVFTNTTSGDQTYNISLSAYACNTNTMIQCSAASLVGPVSPVATSTVSDTRRLIGSRFDEDGNLVYIFESETSGTTYTVVLTGEI